MLDILMYIAMAYIMRDTGHTTLAALIITCLVFRFVYAFLTVSNKK